MFVTPKEARKKIGLLDIVEVPSHSRTITVLTNEPGIFSADKHTENVNAKLTPCVGSSVEGQLAMNKLRIFCITLKVKFAHLGVQRILWVAERVRCIRKLEFDKEVHSREIGLGISLRLITEGIDADIRRKFVTKGIRNGVCIDELQ